ncbi:MAG TPA: hypothetical protein PLS69_09505 [Terricaulis sp.]|nr:hypothetical protein [Terricaulis sp.]HRP11108.1 hypothetical protein [Terricaulis sp.]
MTDAEMIGAVGAMFAVIAGSSLLIAAIAFSRRASVWVDEFSVGYDLFAAQFPTQNR